MISIFRLQVESSSVGGGGLMHGIRIPQQEFALKMQGGGDVFAGPYGNSYLPQMEQQEPKGQVLFHLGKVRMLPLATHSHTHYHLFPLLPLSMCVD